MIPNQSIALTDRFVQGAGNIVSDMDGEKVMLSIHNSKYYNLGEVGGDIWEQLAQPAEVERIVDSLMRQYEVERDDCEHQVVSFLQHLLEEGLIQWA
ncbi:lasso peptide biosynthesis PqqD family chaperone [Paenibacillus doosanensis]|uniref:Coenzyme PQQ synthesis protein D (PqqD) n=1 Tax=Paenibacillus konkukensis TaxID=2020716 RepID=A0ABY4RUG6_9BACL|nr:MULTISPECIES: lasso peptide biosynthesis PqqD family chaperone [Paenibacillus]MCS7461011.1 lasso peptide biosynthesis PqqD family chaperone [Paenibacillus doosanensis]UQZ85682.1 Coenzyme PQQ synthesis protein D (PqqD) [Paenibacillus konkukensis]